MLIKVICFTKNGYKLAGQLNDLLDAHELQILYKGKLKEENGFFVRPEDLCDEPLEDICRKAFSERTALLFIGAMGICIRHIAPFVKDKLKDPPVLVMDERGIHVIPVLSGHVGGANELASEIARLSGADPVLTTATDLAQAFSVDLFAKENHLSIVNREGIAKVSVKALEGKPVTLCIKDYPPSGPVDVIITDEEARYQNGTIALKPKKYTLGIGCKKGKSFEEIEQHVLDVLEKAGIGICDIFAVGTIDIKAEEPGLSAFSRKYSIPLFAYDADLLMKAKGDFSASDFVKGITGVDNVCERAAVLSAGPFGKLIVKKQAHNGVTAAVAKTGDYS